VASKDNVHCLPPVREQHPALWKALWHGPPRLAKELLSPVREQHPAFSLGLPHNRAELLVPGAVREHAPQLSALLLFPIHPKNNPGG